MYSEIQETTFTENKAGALSFMTAPHLSCVHAFTTRFGGVSTGIFDSLNLKYGTGDADENVERNYGLLGAALGFDSTKLALTRQIHGVSVRAVTTADLKPPAAPVPEADGLITADPNVPLVIFIADCVPILLDDPVRGAIGAVHAGWRGTVADIAGIAVRQMMDTYGCRPSDIRAAIGPCISSCCFETGDDVVDALRDTLGADSQRLITQTGTKPHVDLKAANAFLLQRAGLSAQNIQLSSECTFCHSDKYWSHRATSGKRGSQAAVIMMKGRPH